MKHKLYIYLFILISILVLIILQMNVNRELFVLGDQDFNYRTIDRISYGDGRYSYCIGGRATCKNNSLTSVPIDLSKNNINFPSQYYDGGKTYKPYCMTNGVEDISNKLKCDGSRYSRMNIADMSTNVLPLSNLSFPISSEYTGFTMPYSYVPAAIDATNRNKINFFKDIKGTIAEYDDICNLYSSHDADDDNCKKSLAGTITGYPKITAGVPEYDPNDLGLTSQSTISSQSKKSDSGSSSDSGTISGSGSSSGNGSYSGGTNKSSRNCSAKIKCIADFGTEIGDALCCGQLGVLKDTKYVCPSVAPTCSNFDCKTQFGYCQ